MKRHRVYYYYSFERESYAIIMLTVKTFDDYKI